MSQLRSLAFFRIFRMATPPPPKAPVPTPIKKCPCLIRQWLTNRAASCLFVVFLLLLAGCTRAKVKLGWRLPLDQVLVASMQAKLAKGQGIAPGEKVSLIVLLTEPDGKILATEGKGHGKIMWKDLQTTATVVSTNHKGSVALPRDPRISDGKVPHVVITVPSHPDLRAELDIPLRYDREFSANFSGSSGSSGFNGTDGSDGLSGSTGSLDPNNPSPGGDGGNGSDGSNGSDGGRGGDASEVFIRVALRDGSQPLLQVSISSRGDETFYLIDPHGGSLTVSADGGSGGTGGKGGRGGRGGSGGIGSPNGSRGRDGSDGRNGSDGSRGNGGLITVTYDPAAKAFLKTLHLSSRNGPDPVYREQTVAALW